MHEDRTHPDAGKVMVFDHAVTNNLQELIEALQDFAEIAKAEGSPASTVYTDIDYVVRLEQEILTDGSAVYNVTIAEGRRSYNYEYQKVRRTPKLQNKIDEQIAAASPYSEAK